MYKTLNSLLGRVEKLSQPPNTLDPVGGILLRMRLHTAFEIWQGVDETKFEEKHDAMRRAITGLRAEGVTPSNARTWMEEQVVRAEEKYTAHSG